MKKIKLLAGISVAMTSMAIFIPITASAGSGGCQLGYASYWEYNDFNGRSGGNHYDGPVVASLNNKTNAVSANGKTCSITRYYDRSDRTGAYFIMNSETAAGYNYRDPNLGNGAGFGSWSNENWTNRISSVEFDGPDCR